MTAILVGILFGILITFLIYGCFLLLRNERVFKFRWKIRHKCYQNIHKKLEDCCKRGIGEHWTEYAEYGVIMEKLADKWKYKDMLYTTTPLELEYWYTDDEIELINNLKQ